jgi:glycerol-3-phosphate dehydrogenase
MDKHGLFNDKKTYDVIIVGGGIYGAVIARECSKSGFSTVLLEKDDFCSSTSANSLNVLHGGLRYLQHLNLRRMRRSIYSRRYFQQISPENIDITPFITPLNGWGINGPVIMRIALLVNDIISVDRNMQISRQQHIPGGKVLSRKNLINRLPVFSENKLNGAALWYEAVMNDARHLASKLLDSAIENGAVIMNRTEASELLHQQGKVTGLRCIRQIEDKPVSIKGHIVIDTSGKCSEKLGKSLPAYQPMKQYWSRAVNMQIDKRLFEEYAVGLKYRDNVQDRDARFNSANRHLFFLPNKNGSAIGTFYEPENNVDGDLTISQYDRRRYLDAVNSVLPDGSINDKNITGWQCGWLPLDDDPANGQLNFAKTSRIRAIEANGEFTGLLEVRSVKFTTAPAVAKDVMKIIKKVTSPKFQV